MSHSRQFGENFPMEAAALIVEDHPLYRDALLRLLGGVFGSPATVAAPTAEEGLAIAARAPGLRVVFLDMGLPGMCGMEAVSVFRRACPAAQLIAISGSNDRREVASAFQLGVKAFISKAVHPEMLVSAVEKVLQGGVDAPLWVTCPGDAVAPGGASKQLTARQVEILGLLNDGHSNKEIGLRLGISEVRVKQHISALFRVFGTSNRMQLVLAARRLQLPAPAVHAGREALAV